MSSNYPNNQSNKHIYQNPYIAQNAPLNSIVHPVVQLNNNLNYYIPIKCYTYKNGRKYPCYVYKVQPHYGYKAPPNVVYPPPINQVSKPQYVYHHQLPPPYVAPQPVNISKPIQPTHQVQPMKQNIQPNVNPNSQSNINPNSQPNVNSNSQQNLISDDQYVEQVKHLMKKFGLDDEEIPQQEIPIEDPIDQDMQIIEYYNENIDLDSLKNSEKFIFMQKMALEEYERNFDDPAIVDQFKSVQSFVGKAKSFNKLGWPIWEIASTFSQSHAKTYNVQSSYGFLSSVQEVIEDEWVLVEDDETTKSNKNVSFEHDHLNNGYKELETILLSEEPNLQSLITIVKKFGVRNDLRAFTWQLLLNYIEPSIWKRGQALEKKRKDYYSKLEKNMNESMPKNSLKNLNMILLDSPRTTSDCFPNIIRLTCVRRSLERVLFTWCTVYHSIGYFQGLNEISAILFYVFIESALSGFEDINSTFKNDQCTLIHIVEDALVAVEPDVYYCLEKIVNNISKYYPVKSGLLFTEKMHLQVSDILKRSNYVLWRHIKETDVQFELYIFRWTLCLFSREMSNSNTICLWDSYILEGEEGFGKQHVYTLAGFFSYNSKLLLQINNNEELMRTLLNMPTMNYTNKEIIEIVKEANRLKNDYPLNH